MKFKNHVRSALVLLAFVASTANASTITAVTVDTVWKENGSSIITPEGSVTLDSGAIAFGPDLSLPLVGDIITFTEPSQLVSDVLPTDQALQVEKLFGTLFYAGVSMPNERSASFSLALKKILRDFSPTWAYDIRSGTFSADSGGVQYYSEAVDFFFPAEDIVNGVLSSAHSSAPIPVYVTNGWFSTGALNPVSSAPEPETWLLTFVGLVVALKMRRSV